MICASVLAGANTAHGQTTFPLTDPGDHLDAGVSDELIPITAVTPPTPKPKKYNPCSCVSYARYITGINVGAIGFAKNHPVNLSDPVVGAIIITKEGNATGHLAIVRKVTGDNLFVDEANYKKCSVTYGRKINRNSPLIVGYYK